MLGTLREHFLRIKMFGVDNYSCNLLCTFWCKSFYTWKASSAGCVICCFVGPADSKPGNAESRTVPDEATGLVLVPGRVVVTVLRKLKTKGGGLEMGADQLIFGVLI